MEPLFSGEKAYEHLKVLTVDIGPRHGGSRNEGKAARYIRDHFKRLGLKTRLEPYPLYSFEDAAAQLSIPGGGEIPCAAIPMTAATPPRGITRDVLFIEEADASYLDERVRDKIVVMFESFSGELQAKFHSFGPAGLVSIQTRANQRHFRGTDKADARRRRGSVPSVRLTLEDGMALLSDMPERLRLRVSSKDEKVTKGYNVVADLEGSGDEDEVVVVCAHYDSVWAGPGAFDNGGGTAGIMELARVYKEKGCGRNLRFIAFGGEEMGIWGAKAYVKKLKDENDKTKKDKDFERDGLRTEFDRLRFVVNLDMMGPYYGKSNAIALGHGDIAASVRLFAKEVRYPISVRENHVYSSDNMAFNYAEIPSLSFNRCGYGNLGGHTEDDKIENCSPEGLAHLGCFVERWTDRHIVSMHTFPFPKALPEAAKTAVKDWFKGKDPLDYEVFGPEKKYTPKKRKRR